MPQAESLRRCRRTRLHAVRLLAAHTPKQRRLTNRADCGCLGNRADCGCLGNRTHPVGTSTSLALTTLCQGRSPLPLLLYVAMGKQRVPTSARMPIFDAQLLRELHAQAAAVNISLEGQRAPAIVVARDQISSAIKVGCSEFPSSRLLIKCIHADAMTLSVYLWAWVSGPSAPLHDITLHVAMVYPLNVLEENWYISMQ